MRVGATRHCRGVAQLLRPQRKDGPETEVLSGEEALREGSRLPGRRASAARVERWSNLTGRLA
jgi:hypothetical protein